MHEAKSAANTPSLQYTFYNKESFRSNKNINKYNYHKPVSTWTRKDTTTTDLWRIIKPLPLKVLFLKIHITGQIMSYEV